MTGILNLATTKTLKGHFTSSKTSTEHRVYQTCSQIKNIFVFIFRQTGGAGEAGSGRKDKHLWKHQSGTEKIIERFTF